MNNTSCWECDEVNHDLPTLRCNWDGCKQVLHIYCYEAIFGKVDDPKTKDDLLLCNEHYPHICGWCGNSGPSIPCDLCFEEGIKQYVCEICNLEHNEDGIAICRVCDSSGSIASTGSISEKKHDEIVSDGEWYVGCTEYNSSLSSYIDDEFENDSSKYSTSSVDSCESSDDDEV